MRFAHCHSSPQLLPDPLSSLPPNSVSLFSIKATSCCLNVLGYVLFCCRVGSWPGLHIPRERELSLSQQLTIASSLPRSRTSWPPLLSLLLWSGLHKTCAYYHSHCALVCKAPLLCPEDTSPLLSSTLWLPHSFPLCLLQWLLSLWKREYDVNVLCRAAEHSEVSLSLFFSLYLGQLLVSINHQLLPIEITSGEGWGMH